MAKAPFGLSASPLRHGQLSNSAVLFQSISQVAPAGGIASVAILGANFAGGALPLATIFSIVACLLVALSVSELAKHLPSAGSIGTYISRSLGGPTGFVTGWMYAISELLIVSFVALLIGALVGGLLKIEWGWPFTATWVVTTIIVYLLVAFVHEMGVTVSAEVQKIISVIEVLLFLALSATLIVKAGSHNTLSVFGTSHGNVEGFKGISGVFPAAVYIITAFAGFEAAAALAEEAREPRRAVRTAVLGSVMAIGVLYLLTSYAATVFFGADKMGGFAAYNGGDPWTGMTRSVWGVGWVALFLVVVNSLYGACTAAMTVSTRMLVSLSRSGLGPASLARVSKRGAPSIALAFAGLIGLGLELWLGVKYGPIVGVGILVTASTLMYVTLYILVNLACTAYFWRHQRAEFNWFKHFLLPLLGAAAFVPVLLVVLGIPAFNFITKLAAPLTYGAYAAMAIVIAAILVAVYFAVTSPTRLQQFGVAFDEKPSEENTWLPALGVNPVSTQPSL